MSSNTESLTRLQQVRRQEQAIAALRCVAYREIIEQRKQQRREKAKKEKVLSLVDEFNDIKQQYQRALLAAGEAQSQGTETSQQNRDKAKEKYNIARSREKEVIDRARVANSRMQNQKQVNETKNRVVQNAVETKKQEAASNREDAHDAAEAKIAAMRIAQMRGMSIDGLNGPCKVTKYDKISNQSALKISDRRPKHMIARVIRHGSQLSEDAMLVINDCENAFKVNIKRQWRGVMSEMMNIRKAKQREMAAQTQMNDNKRASGLIQELEALEALDNTNCRSKRVKSSEMVQPRTIPATLDEEFASKFLIPKNSSQGKESRNKNLIHSIDVDQNVASSAETSIDSIDDVDDIRTTMTAPRPSPHDPSSNIPHKTISNAKDLARLKNENDVPIWIRPGDRVDLKAADSMDGTPLTNPSMTRGSSIPIMKNDYAAPKRPSKSRPNEIPSNGILQDDLPKWIVSEVASPEPPSFNISILSEDDVPIHRIKTVKIPDQTVAETIHLRDVSEQSDSEASDHEMDDSFESIPVDTVKEQDKPEKIMTVRPRESTESMISIYDMDTLLDSLRKSQSYDNPSSLMPGRKQTEGRTRHETNVDTGKAINKPIINPDPFESNQPKLFDGNNLENKLQSSSSSDAIRQQRDDELIALDIRRKELLQQYQEENNRLPKYKCKTNDQSISRARQSDQLPFTSASLSDDISVSFSDNVDKHQFYRSLLPANNIAKKPRDVMASDSASSEKTGSRTVAGSKSSEVDRYGRYVSDDLHYDIDEDGSRSDHSSYLNRSPKSSSDSATLRDTDTIQSNRMIDLRSIEPYDNLSGKPPPYRPSQERFQMNNFRASTSVTSSLTNSKAEDNYLHDAISQQDRDYHPMKSEREERDELMRGLDLESNDGSGIFDISMDDDSLSKDHHRTRQGMQRDERKSSLNEDYFDIFESDGSDSDGSSIDEESKEEYSDIFNYLQNNMPSQPNHGYDPFSPSIIQSQRPSENTLDNTLDESKDSISSTQSAPSKGHESFRMNDENLTFSIDSSNYSESSRMSIASERSFSKSNASTPSKELVKISDYSNSSIHVDKDIHRKLDDVHLPDLKASSSNLIRSSESSLIDSPRDRDVDDLLAEMDALSKSLVDRRSRIEQLAASISISPSVASHSSSPSTDTLAKKSDISMTPGSDASSSFIQPTPAQSDGSSDKGSSANQFDLNPSANRLDSISSSDHLPSSPHNLSKYEPSPKRYRQAPSIVSVSKMTPDPPMRSSKLGSNTKSSSSGSKGSGPTSPMLSANVRSKLFTDLFQSPMELSIDSSSSIQGIESDVQSASSSSSSTLSFYQNDGQSHEDLNPQDGFSNISISSGDSNSEYDVMNLAELNVSSVRYDVQNELAHMRNRLLDIVRTRTIKSATITSNPTGSRLPMRKADDDRSRSSPIREGHRLLVAARRSKSPERSDPLISGYQNEFVSNRNTTMDTMQPARSSILPFASDEMSDSSSDKPSSSAAVRPYPLERGVDNTRKSEFVNTRRDHNDSSFLRDQSSSPAVGSNSLRRSSDSMRQSKDLRSSGKGSIEIESSSVTDDPRSLAAIRPYDAESHPHSDGSTSKQAVNPTYKSFLSNPTFKISDDRYRLALNESSSDADSDIPSSPAAVRPFPSSMFEGSTLSAIPSSGFKSESSDLTQDSLHPKSESNGPYPHNNFPVEDDTMEETSMYSSHDSPSSPATVRPLSLSSSSSSSIGVVSMPAHDDSIMNQGTSQYMESLLGFQNSADDLSTNSSDSFGDRITFHQQSEGHSRGSPDSSGSASRYRMNADIFDNSYANESNYEKLSGSDLSDNHSFEEKLGISDPNMRPRPVRDVVSVLSPWRPNQNIIVVNNDGDNVELQLQDSILSAMSTDEGFSPAISMVSVSDLSGLSRLRTPTRSLRQPDPET